MSYIEHFTYYFLLYSIIKNLLYSKSRKQSLVITKLREIPVFIFSHSKPSFISFNLLVLIGMKKNRFSTLSVYRLFLRNTGRNRKKTILEGI